MLFRAAIKGVDGRSRIVMGARTLATNTSLTLARTAQEFQPAGTVHFLHPQEWVVTEEGVRIGLRASEQLSHSPLKYEFASNARLMVDVNPWFSKQDGKSAFFLVDSTSSPLVACHAITNASVIAFRLLCANHKVTQGFVQVAKCQYIDRSNLSAHLVDR